MREREIAGAILCLLVAGVMAASLPYTHGAWPIALTVVGICLALGGAARSLLKARSK